MKSKPVALVQDPSKKLARKHLTLYEIFKEQQLLGWQILDYESSLYSEMDISIESITILTSLYMKAIEKLNSLQDPREQYFNLKMQKLMAEPYVIRCFNHNQDQKKSALDSRRKDLEQKIEKEVERQNHRKVVQQVILAQEEKEKKMMNKVKEIVEQSHKNLEDRIRKRSQIKQMRNSILNSSQFMESERSMGSASPRFSSIRTKRDRFHNQVDPNSSFDLNISQDQEFKNMKKEIEEEQQEQRLQRKLQRKKQQDVLLN